MLILSRKTNEAIVFSTSQGDIVVEVVRVNRDKVRLGIECDKSISVHRKEVFDQIKIHKKFNALGEDEEGCGPDGNYVDQ